MIKLDNYKIAFLENEEFYQTIFDFLNFIFAHYKILFVYYSSLFD